jgi:signal peptidase I
VPDRSQRTNRASVSALADRAVPPHAAPEIAPSPPTQGKRRPRRRVPASLPSVLAVALIAVAVLALLVGIEAFLVKPFRVPSASMEPTLHIGQRVLVNRFIYDLQTPHRGDIVVFHPPRTSSCAITRPTGQPCPRAYSHTDPVFYVKRILGLPGERISIRDGHPVINGRELINERYAIPCPRTIPICELPEPITVPPGHYFVIGDNRPDSLDSRLFGPIPASAIVGQVFFTYWPPDRVGTP